MYLGRQLTSGNYLKLDNISSQFNSTIKTFNLTTAGQPFYPGSVFSVLISVGGAIQEPATSYTIDQATITFASAPTGGSAFFGIVLGLSLGIGVPADGTVTGVKLSSPFNYNSGLLYLDSVNNRVGILSTSPTVTLDVVGNAKVSGTTNLNGLSVSGICTVSSLSIGATSVISSARQLQNITSLDATTTATIESAITNAPNTFTDLKITGISTLGVTSATNFIAQSLSVSGISTLGVTSVTNLTAQQLNISGIVTATTFVGALTGTATSTTNIPNLTGAITSNNTTTSLGSFSSSNLATALTDETGSGSAVFATSPTLVTPSLGIATATNLTTQQLNVSGVSTSLTSINTPFYTNPSIITSSYTVPINQNSFTAGPIGIDTGITISVSSGSYWKVI